MISVETLVNVFETPGKSRIQCFVPLKTKRKKHPNALNELTSNSPFTSGKQTQALKSYNGPNRLTRFRAAKEVLGLR